MRIPVIVLVATVACAASLVAQEGPTEAAVFAAALDNIPLELRGAPPADRQYLRDGQDLHAIVVARRTIGGAPAGYRTFVEKWCGSVISEELLQSYGDNGPAPRTIDREAIGGYSVVPLESFETGTVAYDWQRLNEKYPGVRHVVRLSWPAVDRLGTYAVVRYELLGRDRPENSRRWPWQHASFVKFEKQLDGSWKRSVGVIGALWE